MSDPLMARNVEITWAKDGLRVLLAINDYPHAVFDFKERRGYCRTNYPNVPSIENESWQSDDHNWSDKGLAAILWENGAPQRVRLNDLVEDIHHSMLQEAEKQTA
jgi:Uncharacterized protein conserved in bacteria (DUF2251)